MPAGQLGPHHKKAARVAREPWARYRATPHPASFAWTALGLGHVPERCRARPRRASFAWPTLVEAAAAAALQQGLAPPRPAWSCDRQVGATVRVRCPASFGEAIAMCLAVRRRAPACPAGLACPPTRGPLPRRASCAARWGLDQAPWGPSRLRAGCWLQAARARRRSWVRPGQRAHVRRWDRTVPVQPPVLRIAGKRAYAQYCTALRAHNPKLPAVRAIRPQLRSRHPKVVAPGPQRLWVRVMHARAPAVGNAWKPGHTCASIGARPESSSAR